MASLKEVKNRISMVTGTRKITSAMKMVASSKLHRASSAIEQMRPYEAAIGRIMASFMSGTDGDGLTSPLAAEREVKRATLVVFTSNSSLCGGFNAHAIAAMHHAIADYRARGVEIVRVWCFGRKGAEAARRSGYPVDETYVAQTDHPTYAPAADLARLLMQDYLSGATDEVTIIYHHFKSAGTQILRSERYLPIRLESQAAGHTTSGWAADYIIEPGRVEVMSALVPQSLSLNLYAAWLDSLASEHAARVIAMQVATDNADELLRELRLTYNKTRQQAITTELLDIVGGSMH